MLAELIRANQPCVVLTGAGVSTESGIPDFRSASGIWAQYDPYEVASIEAFHRDPVRVWEFYAHRLDVLADAAPNPAHLALAELESRGLVQTVITQNVDRLHAAAGSREVIEVHGSIDTAVCLACGRREERVRELLPLPGCVDCAAVLLVVGTSLEVWPVAGLPEETLAHGGKLAIVNREATPYDARAELIIH